MSHTVEEIQRESAVVIQLGGPQAQEASSELWDGLKAVADILGDNERGCVRTALAAVNKLQASALVVDTFIANARTAYGLDEGSQRQREKLIEFLDSGAPSRPRLASSHRPTPRMPRPRRAGATRRVKT
jgi:hypothetical protein